MRAWMLVFSSALMTNSSFRRGWSSHRLAYRSNIRPALGTKSGSRGKIQVRCCQGRMASSLSQRHTVLSLTVATMPQRFTARTMSAVLKRDSGNPSLAGNSQAIALTCTTTSGGGKPEGGRGGVALPAQAIAP